MKNKDMILKLLPALTSVDTLEVALETLYHLTGEQLSELETAVREHLLEIAQQKHDAQMADLEADDDEAQASYYASRWETTR